MAKQMWKCEWCLNPYEADRRPLWELHALRMVLKVPMTQPFEPPICDSCYASVMGSANTPEQVTGVEAPKTSMGFPNLLLAKSMAR